MTFATKPLLGKNNYSFKHGMSNTPTWNSWRAMRQRCRGQGNDAHLYKNIKICKRWEKFENFLADMGERPEGKTLDRINGKGHYTPSNCRWATPKEQAQNTLRQKTRRPYKSSPTYHGKTYTEWARILGLSVQVVRYRISVGKSLFETKRKYLDF